MIDLNDFRARPEAYQKACADKRINFDVDAFLKLDQEYREAKQVIESLRSEQNKLSKELPKVSAEEKPQKLAAMKELAGNLKEQEVAFKEQETEWKTLQLLIPGVPLDKVPVGKDDSENVELYTWGEIPKFDFEAKDHDDLGSALDIIDVPRGVKVAGARSYFLKGAGARLQHAVLQLAIDQLTEANYTIMDCPHIVLYETMQGTGYFPGGEEMAYHLDERDEKQYLIGTSEVSVCAYHANEIVKRESLPLRYAGYSPCYRREAGTYGKDTKGLYRVHQFYKVEQVIVCEADADISSQMHQELLSNAEKLMQSLELPYRVVDVCTGDMGQGQIYKNDIEAWMPSRKHYCETHSCSTFYDFQARRLQLRYKDEDGKNTYCHTLNNTCVASPRILIPLLENYQNKDGSVRVPKVLQKYMGGLECIEPNE